MSRVCKKIAGLFGLAFVIGITAAASGIPPMRDASAASSDVTVEFKVIDVNFMAQIINPAEGSVSYTDGGVTARVTYADAQTISIYLTYPDGHQVLVDTVTPPTDTGELDIPLPVTSAGSYTVTVTGTDIGGSSMNGDAKAFTYRSITAAVNAAGDKIAVDYGTNVCKLGFQVYKITDPTHTNPLLSPAYTLEVQQTGAIPNTIDVAIPGFANLGQDEFDVVVTAYSCLSDDPIDTEDVPMTGTITPPKTGAINILGITISQTDYLITGLITFALAAIFAIFLLARRKKAPRRR